ncbi:hypothetical protein SCB49_01272 [unidentified eubacterium SCB49]|nr:hypothetical protein SCB49_01272 [unidentified eubacterium SCB49]
MIGQELSRQESIIKYLTINGTQAQYESAYDQMFDVLEQQFKDAKVPTEVWSELKSKKTMAINQVVSMLASAYRDNFDKADINTLIDFYSSGTGQQIVQDPTKLTKEQNKELANFHESVTGQKMFEVRSKLEKDIAQISEYWSRDLYKGTVDGLIAKGYQPVY